jgi:small subunit ribosomal protein S6
MNNYELALVVNAKIDDDARAAVVDKAKALIERFGGKVGETEEWGKRKLAYEIQKMNEGYYYFVQFEAEPSAPEEIESRMRIAENVLRYLIVRKDENDDFTVAPEKTEAPAAEETAAAPAEEAPAAEEKAEEAAPAEEKAE